MATAPSEPEGSRASAGTIAELARERQLVQIQAIDSLDAKAATLVGFAGLILTLLFTSSYTTAHWNIALSVGASFVTAAVIPLGLALAPRRYKLNPNIAALEKLYIDRPTVQTQTVVVESIGRALTWNADRTRRKVQLITAGVAMLVVGFGFAGGGLIYSVQEGGHATQQSHGTRSTPASRH